MNLLALVVFIISFFLGSIPFKNIVGRIFHDKGLKRIAVTFVLDASKGMLSIALASPVGCHFLASAIGMADAESRELSQVGIWAAGFFAVLGHCYSPWLHFRGGKGVSTGLGVAMVLSPISALVGIFGFAILFYYKRIVSLSSIAALILTAIIYMVIHPSGVHLWVGAALLFLILIRHEANIDALLEGRESPVSPGAVSKFF